MSSPDGNHIEQDSHAHQVGEGRPIGPMLTGPPADKENPIDPKHPKDDDNRSPTTKSSRTKARASGSPSDAKGENAFPHGG
ncbi:hypothetical protein TWF481_010712 [Arthrobotrys musiformis]|uniref:Uncharacterized protein n=1 Tax=Arthrobotrys musiformis TaxID=47236 RepID=A0AAV9W1K1_9PEZI